MLTARRTNPRFRRIGLASASALTLGAAAASAADCGSLAGKTFGPATVTSATSVSPPSKFLGLNSGMPAAASGPMCRVEGAIKTSSDSSPLFEVWLPPPGAWNGKYEGVGNGGFAGSIIYESMDWALGGGYAVAGTDTGHSGTPFDSAWAAGHPEKIVDFGWRAIHETAAAAKAIVAAYYGKPPSHAYFSGCSDGGREALMEAQRFPGDYDGVVAGAPANYWTRLSVNSVASDQALTATPDSWLSPAKLALVSKAAVEACHGVDGIIDDPGQCHFDPSVLACKGEASDACLSEPQLTALEHLYAGARDSNGKSINPGYPAGGESLPYAWPLWITGTEPKRITATLLYAFEMGFFRDLVTGQSNWDFRGQDLADLLKQADAKMGGTINAVDPDLSAFRAAGGKLIQYHGWADAAIPPATSILYYDDVGAKMGGVQGLASFYRLFMAPGMQHCGGGLGPSAVGGVFGPNPPSRDPEHDLVSALSHWVEDGVAPEKITATLYQDGDPSKGIAAQRPWCAYPKVAQYNGQGRHSEAASFVCSASTK
jgi:feruloyl esterase